jgi:hypothetical protein
MVWPVCSLLGVLEFEGGNKSEQNQGKGSWDRLHVQVAPDSGLCTHARPLESLWAL